MAAAAVVLSACRNNDLDPKYTTPAEVTGLYQTYRVFNDIETVHDSAVPADTPVEFGGTVTSLYGPVEGYLSYQTCSPAKQKELNLKRDNIYSSDWYAYWISDDPEAEPKGMSDDDGTYVILESPVRNSPFKLTMPAQPAGTVVNISIEMFTPYMPSLSGYTVYAVEDKAEPEPEPEPTPDPAE